MDISYKEKVIEDINISYVELKECEDEMERIRQNINMFKQNINDNIKIKQEIESENKILRTQYEDAFKNANKNRLSINKQPDESEEDYIQRMKELENEKYSTVLYIYKKQY